MLIEICPFEGRASACCDNGESLIGSEFESDLLDCVSSGDCEPACMYVLEIFKPEFRIVAKGSDGKYENRLATCEEKQATCEVIYYDSDTDFSDETNADMYLIWQAASEFESEGQDNG